VAAYDDPQEATVALVVEAYRLWLQYETRTDDITAIVIQARCARVPVWPGSRAALHVSAALLLLGGLQPALCCSAHMTCRVHAPSYQGVPCNQGTLHGTTDAWDVEQHVKLLCYVLTAWTGRAGRSAWGGDARVAERLRLRALTQRRAGRSRWVGASSRAAWQLFFGRGRVRASCRGPG